MSGGVDSSVAKPGSLKEQGYDVIGVTMQIWQDEETECPEQEEHGGRCGSERSRRRPPRLPGTAWDSVLRDELQRRVQRECHGPLSCTNIRNGRTPNPCIACNRYVKWESLLKQKPTG
ncbi:MAG: hypothetical protein ACLT76_10635 [Clostridium fessum]